jgi:hypothetical protein
MSLPGGSRLKNAHLHAIILGSSFLISLTIVLVRISVARRASDGGTEPAVTVMEAKPAPKAAPPGDGKSDGAAEVEGLIERADELYQSSALAEGRDAELGEAQNLLEQASEILETLPENDPRTKELKIRWSQLRQDVSRASNL